MGPRATSVARHREDAGAFATCERPDTHQDTPPDAFRV
jgi:hypothetical protein